MKNIPIIVIIFLFTSCIKENETGTMFYVKNSSNHNVTLTVFDADLSMGSSFDTTYILLRNTSIYCDFSTKEKDSPYDYPFGVSADSAYIIFDDSLRIIYKQPIQSLDTSKRNVLNIESYSGVKERKSVYTYTYTITDADYANAVKIK